MTSSDRSVHTARAIKYGANVVIATLLFFGVLVAINFFATKSNKRIDLTKNEQFTVSPATKQLLGRLQDKVTVTAYATAQDTPPNWTEQRRQLRDLLYEYRLISKGRLSYKFVDPSVTTESERQAQQAGIQEQPMQKADTKELSVKMGYLGLVVEYRGKPETIPAINPRSSLEYQLTRVINKVAEVETPTVGIIAPGGNPFMGQQSNYQAVNQFFEHEGFKVKSIEESKVDLTDVKLLVVFEPGELSEEALFRIDQFVMGGGKLFVASSGVELDQRSGQAQGKSPKINSLLESYGIRVNQDLLEDWGKGFVLQVPSITGGYVMSRNPFVMELTDLAKKSPFTEKLPRLVALLPSSVTTTEKGTSATVEVVGRTSERTRKQEQFFILDQKRLRPPAASEKTESYPIIMSVKATEQGPITSRYAVAEPPIVTNDDGTTKQVAMSEVKTRSVAGAQVVVFGSTMSFTNEVVAEFQPNGFFLLNIADALTRGGEMIGLRSKQAHIASLKSDINLTAARTSQALAIGLVPLLLIVFGIIKLYLNRIRRARYRSVYGGTQ